MSTENNFVLPETISTLPSIVFVTMHKAGSTVANSILERLLSAEGYKHVDFAGESFRKGVTEGDYCVERSHLISRPGYYFGAYRGLYVEEFADLSGNPIVIQIRDPRDCLVSMYYSIRFSHPAPGDGVLMELFERNRRHANEINIDAYVLEKMGHYDEAMRVIKYVMDRCPNHVVLKYEDMVTNFNHWFENLYEFIKVIPSSKTMDEIRQVANFKVVAENANHHKRQVIPGDFRRKLQVNTQKELTEGLSSYLELFGYVLD